MSEQHPPGFVSTVLPVVGLVVSLGAAVAVGLVGPWGGFDRAWLDPSLRFATLLLAAGLAGHSLTWLARTTLLRVAAKTKTGVDDLLLARPVVSRLAQALPWAVVYFGLPHVFGGPGTPVAQPEWVLPAVEIGRRLALALALVSLLRTVSPVLEVVNDLYNHSRLGSPERQIKGYLQVVSILAHGGLALAVVAVLAGMEPGAVFAGLGAVTAVLLLVFRDTILSLVASIQIATNDMIRVGDWVSMPQANADGDVIDTALHTVKVQNWDKTISTIPTSKFITESFKNWRGMSESGGRRIKRALHIDMNSVRFLDEQAANRLSRYETIREYMRDKLEDIRRHDREKGLAPASADAESEASGEELVPERRRLTNIGTFRAYVERYLRSHPGTHKEMTLLTRQLPPGPKGIPIEIYCFSNDTAWATYEGLQADIFDHLIAMLPEFDLRVFQEPTGAELATGLRGSRVETEKLERRGCAARR